ncbi:unnamed protein product [Danaus chrysippus]|uniref:(African queen) hypothetical protein n=1 Tax=Danaus chrysippus TaxID=151541 RepID=A0A8J2QWB6_9NEOP|nr:unnamed protein product [Danaus chrysippus]
MEKDPENVPIVEPSSTAHKKRSGIGARELQTLAVPLPAAIRVGLASVAEYSRMMSAWDKATVHDLCSIHQYYRVELNPYYFKLYLARYA